MARSPANPVAARFAEEPRLQHFEIRMNAQAIRPLICLPALLAGLCFAATPAFSQAAPSETDLFVSRINAAAHALGSQPKLSKMSEQDRQKLTEFVVGNMLFVMLH